MSWTLGFVGAGVMAEVMIAGLLDEGILKPAQIIASNRRAARSSELSRRYGIRCTLDNTEAAREADVVVLSVKPQTLPKVLPELRGVIRDDALVLSIIAGARGRVLRDGLGHEAIIRCMPNLPCRIRHGMTVWYAPKHISAEGIERVEQILGVMGAAVRVTEESHVDRATAVNGTGPAIVAEFVKAMLEAATYIGEPRTVARETVLATIAGTVEMIRQQPDAHVAQLIDEVTSPGGTTSRALQVLKRGSMSAVITESVDAAYQRTIELGAALEERLRLP
ncbi:MAG: pyrroline-5-carboxylate reductase [Myxococcota bacterium]|jgi:pyrroline-5-carboxylate reductase